MTHAKSNSTKSVVCAALIIAVARSTVLKVQLAGQVLTVLKVLNVLQVQFYNSVTPGQVG